LLTEAAPWMTDLSKVDAGDFYPTYDLARFTWDSLDGRLNKSTLTATFQGVSSDPGTAFWNGSISFQVTAYKESGRDASLPRLLHTANSSKVEFVMSGVSPRGNHSRFALEVVTVEERGWRRQLRAVSSIDDEYSPTIFEVALRARPVSPGLSIPGLDWPSPACALQSRPSIALAYFGQELERDHAVAAVNISFGSEDDEAYQEKGYLSWSALIGFGEPPMDSFSPLVIAILAVALGAPVVLLVVGSLAVLAVGNKRHSEYEPIN
uniref:Glycosylated lysosomal membrane protein n=1 Tax=Varanus komodoensis TaxID=61221 RepID=A0A8D2JC48_VARKO